MLSGVRRVRLRLTIGSRSNSGRSSKDGKSASGLEDVESPLRQLVSDAASGGEVAGGSGELEWATQPYVGAGVIARRGTAGDATVLLFPGQGAQHVGMGRRARDIPAAKDVYDEASDVLGWDVWRVCTEGPAEELAARAQPALLATSVAALAAAREERPALMERARVAAGFSLGEWAALVWGGALSLAGALRALQSRQEAMRAAAAARPGAMLCVWLAPAAALPALLAAARQAAGPDTVCCIANYLYPACRVLSGDEKALEWVEREGRRHGVIRAARVAAGGPWHSALVASAGDAVRAALERDPPDAPAQRVLSAIDARAYRDARDVTRRLVTHVAAPVRWEQTLQALYARDPATPQPATLCLGPARDLMHYLRRTNARAWDRALLLHI